MPNNDPPKESIDWSLTTWEGSRREALRRWAELPLERIIGALEEMQELHEAITPPPTSSAPGPARDPGSLHRVHEQASEYHGMTDMDDTPALPGFSATDLAGMDAQALIACLREQGDRAPRDLIDACAARGDVMVQVLEDLLDAPGFWDDEVDAGDWWLRLHTAMILGLMPGEGAGRLLVGLMRRLDEIDDQDTQDWLAGKWPALFANKPADLSGELRALVEDRAHDGYIRVNAMDPYLAFAMRDGATALDSAIDWVAELAAAEDEDWYVRLCLGNTLLDFPRDRHRRMLEALAARQQGLGTHFDARDIEHAYARGCDKPDWERFDDPWEFYHPEAIEARQRRWEEEDRRRAEQAEDWYDTPVWHEPYVRQEPKTGRNDPCPCGSGRKYKKCCLNKAR
jgi:hypothetical protein